ncbi:MULTISPECIES: GNAT family N-acetyltransferase [unclassified Arcicella]|uniref:GNAT family N-acetyltransferase n=1 Tax=unclassified Arcicella TaxID=2644986 RepID=UPI00285505C7|nr:MULTISPECIES: GNAT family N-acetyltransferase [unclassified Arcicella]MDR6563322.1 GNAT superfamily N-acetyltransferase [Arcicella sp. BE51]MDR6813257.1 GNAT superfamily N-acetyltransferase [Arcicella sp. BE140]MDR6824571.1 GNAT superfamily N-acetyltransferase [Arcicella sp. BE139]
MNHIIIRKATFDDLETLYRFEQGVIEAERPFDKTLKNGLIHYYDLEGMITASHIELLVADLEGELIGSGYARIEDAKPYLQHPKHGYLGFMYVDPNHRGKGVNMKIIQALKEWARSQNISELRLDVYHDNISAIKAYEKIGFSKHMIEMRLGL